MTRAEIVERYFLNRSDFVASLAPWGKPCPMKIGGEVELRSVIEAHLGVASFSGELAPSNGKPRRAPVSRIGSYTPDRGGMTKWLCVDLDGAGHADALAEPLGAAEALLAALAAVDIPAHLERSGGGAGFHVWVFFDSAVSAALLRKLAFSVIPKAGLAAGGWADASKNRGIEVFPKTDLGVGDGLGNMVWLPWWAGAPEGFGEFYRKRGGEWVSYAPHGFETASAAQLNRFADVEDRTAKQAARSSAGASSGWPEWRRDVLSRLDLASVYDLAGGKGGEGWLMCRDPESPTGDRSPSACVSDSAREAERGTFHSFRDGRSMPVFDYLVRYGSCADEMDAFRWVADATGVPMPPPKRRSDRDRAETGNSGGGGLPTIAVNGQQLADIIQQAWSAVRNSKRPKLYVRSGEIVVVRRMERGARIRVLNRDGAYGALVRSARWVRKKQDGDGAWYDVDAKPPNEVAGDLIAYPHPGLPRLETIVGTPVFDASGRLVDRPGFDAASGIFYDKTVDVAPVPDRPDTDDVRGARALLEEDVLVDFPFCSEGDLAAAYALFLLPAVRQCVRSFTPIHLIEAPTPGSGKGLIADLVSIVYTGHTAEVQTMPREEEEARKRLTALMRQGRSIVTIDEFPGGKSGNLASAITAETWTDRVLGKQEMLEVENRSVWIIVANNPELSMDLARRSVRIRIDAAVARPWDRQEFKHPVIREWARRHRGDVLHAILTLCRHWVSEGMPAGSRVLGSFDHWSKVMGGLLESIGVPGFLANSADLYQQSDETTAEWAEFARVWWDRHGRAEVKAALLVELARDHELLVTVRGDRGESSQRVRFGRALGKMRGRVVGDWKIESRWDDSLKSKTYRLEYPMSISA